MQLFTVHRCNQNFTCYEIHIVERSINTETTWLCI